MGQCHGGRHAAGRAGCTVCGAARRRCHGRPHQWASPHRGRLAQPGPARRYRIHPGAARRRVAHAAGDSAAARFGPAARVCGDPHQSFRHGRRPAWRPERRAARCGRPRGRPGTGGRHRRALARPGIGHAGLGALDPRRQALAHRGARHPVDPDVGVFTSRGVAETQVVQVDPCRQCRIVRHGFAVDHVGACAQLGVAIAVLDADRARLDAVAQQGQPAPGVRRPAG
ncbi:hypothetical protein G6F35_015200 [Rhizopus arrhizus]|nr:hypothetical protein G6F35_015200 [Rhizopus arrhizus]